MVSQNALASEGPNGDPIATPSIRLYNILLNIKYDSLVSIDRRSLNSFFFSVMKYSMVSSRGMLLKSEPVSKLPMKLLESCSTILAGKLNESLTVYLLLVNGSKTDTKHFASLYVGVCKADKTGLKGRQPSTHLYAFYKNHTLFQFFVFLQTCCLSQQAFYKFYQWVFLADNKIQEIVIF